MKEGCVSTLPKMTCEGVQESFRAPKSSLLERDLPMHESRLIDLAEVAV